jgi:hypothetical protein
VRKLLVALVLLLIVSAVAVFVLVIRTGSKSTPAEAPPVVGSQLAPGVLPRPGVYIYAQRGYEEAKAGPLTIHRRFPPRAILVVSGHGHVVQQEWRYSKQHLEAGRTLVNARGRFTLWNRTKLVMVVTDDEAHDAHPVTLSEPPHMKVGERWTQSYTVGSTHTVSRNRIVRRELHDGKPVLVEIADSTVTGGGHPGTERDVDWHDPTTGLDLRETIDRHIGGSFPYVMHVDVRFLRRQR